MIYSNGRKLFGFYLRSCYEPNLCVEEIENERVKQDSVARELFERRLPSLEFWCATTQAKDIYTGETFQAGIYEDGPFTFTMDFVRYYNRELTELPEEYKEYLFDLEEQGLL